MKILHLDVEVAPNLATVWGIFNQNIAINQLLETSRILCYAAKWHDKKQMIFDSEFITGHKSMMSGLHRLLSEADAVVHYNGDRFDIPTINREFLKYGMPPPDSYHNVDLLKTVRKKFRFTSNKLDHVCQELGIGGKVSHTGHQLWLDCMNNDKKAWSKMERYNKQDVVLLQKLYERLMPWIQVHPNRALYVTDECIPSCPKCGSVRVKKNGFETTQTMRYQRYRCVSCKSPLRGRTNLLTKEEREVILTTSKL